MISSESCGFLSIGARYVREVLPGEIVEISRNGVRTVDIVDRPEAKLPAFCIFEYVYFARSDSIFEGQMVYSVRMNCGRQLAKEAPVDADIVSSVPESGTAAAHGFARQVIRYNKLKLPLSSFSHPLHHTVWPVLCGSAVQEPLCRQDLYPTLEPPPSTWGG